MARTGATKQRRGAAAAAAAALLLACAALPAALADLCPQTADYNGCLRNGCVTLSESSSGGRRGRDSGRRSSSDDAVEETIVCDACGTGYQLVRGGTRRAKCECAPGYAGRGQRGLCEACPPGTQVAPGGPIRLSKCLNCAAGMQPTEDGATCGCPAGMYRVQLTGTQVVDGVAPFACRLCEARTAFVNETAHTQAACRTCRSGLVATADHSTCVKSDDPAAAPPTGLTAAVANFNGALGTSRSRAEELALERMDSKGGAGAGFVNPLKTLTAGAGASRGDARQQAVAEAVPTTGAAGGLTGLFQRAGAGLGASMGALAPGRGGMSLVDMAKGKVDPEVLADAGLPQVSSTAALLGSMARDAFEEIDIGANW